MSLWSALLALAAEELRGMLRRRRAQQRHAQQPVTPRACPQCREIAYSPGQVHCFKCGAALK